jgi:hypothetical protein
MEKGEPRETFSRPGGILALWAGLLVAPVAWLTQMQVAYMVVTLDCSAGTAPLHVTTVVALVAAAAGGYVAWLEWRRAGPAWPGEGAGAVSRSRFMAALGLLTSAMFFVVILAQGVATFILDPCQP